MGSLLKGFSVLQQIYISRVFGSSVLFWILAIPFCRETKIKRDGLGWDGLVWYGLVLVFVLELGFLMDPCL
jgi:hypothetical protein